MATSSQLQHSEPGLPESFQGVPRQVLLGPLTPEDTAWVTGFESGQQQPIGFFNWAPPCSQATHGDDDPGASTRYAKSLRGSSFYSDSSDYSSSPDEPGSSALDWDRMMAIPAPWDYVLELQPHSSAGAGSSPDESSSPALSHGSDPGASKAKSLRGSSFYSDSSDYSSSPDESGFPALDWDRIDAIPAPWDYILELQPHSSAVETIPIAHPLDPEVHDEPYEEPRGGRRLDFGDEPAHPQGVGRDLGSILGDGNLEAWLAGCPEDFQRSVTQQLKEELKLLWLGAMACDAMWGGGAKADDVGRHIDEEEDEEGKAQSSAHEGDDWPSPPASSDGKDEEPRHDKGGAWFSSDDGCPDSSDDADDDEQQLDEEAAAATRASGGRSPVAAAPEEGPARAKVARTMSHSEEAAAKLKKADEHMEGCRTIQTRVQEVHERLQRALQGIRGVLQPQEPQSALSEPQADESCGKGAGEQPPGPSSACGLQAEPLQCFTPHATHPVEPPNRHREANVCTTSLFWVTQAGRHRVMRSKMSGGRPLGVMLSRHERQRGGGDAHGCWTPRGTARGMQQPLATPRWQPSTCRKSWCSNFRGFSAAE